MGDTAQPWGEAREEARAEEVLVNACLTRDGVVVTVGVGVLECIGVEGAEGIDKPTQCSGETGEGGRVISTSMEP